jgi:ubiquitin C-terminal hydrolase
MQNTTFKGIENIGNSCYLNSALQCLLHMPFTKLLDPGAVLEADQKIFEQRFHASITANTEKIIDHQQFKNVLLRLSLDYQVGSDVCDPSEVLSYLRCFQQDFQHLRPCDAQEALLYLLDFLHEAEKKPWDEAVSNHFFKDFSKVAREEWNKYGPMFSMVSINITSQVEENIFCKVCQNIRQKRYPIHTMIDLDEGDVSLLNTGIKKETLDGYECDACRHKDCVKVTCWNHFPEYLLFYNKRKSFFLRESLVLPYVKKKTQVYYELVMSINHRSAHFNCYIRSDCNRQPSSPPRAKTFWYLCDDRNIVKVHTVPFESIYLYVYRKKNGCT